MIRIGGLDGLRGIAVIMVILAHSPVIEGMEWLSTIIKKSNMGYLGVEIFFILSGYLITRILLKDVNAGNKGALKEFYVKRSLRILPVFFIAISACYVLFPDHNYLYPSLFLSNYYFSFDLSPHPLRHFWSLAVEEQYYIFWPLLLMWVKGDKLKYLVIALASTSLAVILVRGLFFDSETSRALLMRGTEARMIALAAGGAFAIWGIPKLSIRLFTGLSVTLVAILLAAFIAGKSINDSQLLAVKALCFLILACLLFMVSFESRISKLLSCGWLTFSGKISYGLYVYHLPVFYYLGMSHMQGASTDIMTLITIYTLVIAIALLSWTLIERPCMDLKNKYIERSFKNGTING